MKFPNLRIMAIATAAAGALALVPTASATVTGTLSVDANGTVTVTSSTITWNPTAGALQVVAVAPPQTMVSTDDGTVAVGTTGNLKDLTAPSSPSFSVSDFITLNGAYTDVNYTLRSIGPGTTPDCTAVTAASAPGTSCSIVLTSGPLAGTTSPFILTWEGAPGGVETTNVSLNVGGTVTDHSGVVTSWGGQFTEPLNGYTRSSIESIINGGGSVTSGYAGQFTATAVPEPTTAFLGLSGLLLTAGLVRRRKRS